MEYRCIGLDIWRTPVPPPRRRGKVPQLYGGFFGQGDESPPPLPTAKKRAVCTNRPARHRQEFPYTLLIFGFQACYTWGNKSGLMEEANMEDNKSTTVKKTVKSGITFGSALAMVISYTTWKSVGWAIFHGLLSWVYVIYFLLRY